jgi:hypothetical protein
MMVMPAICKKPTAATILAMSELGAFDRNTPPVIDHQ